MESIENTPDEKISKLVEMQRKFFASKATMPYKYRIEQLKKLQTALTKWETPLCDALWNDLHKSPQEAVLTEISIVGSEIKCHIKNLKSWMKRKRCSTPLKMFPSKSFTVNEPLGNTLIISPWNYPIQLLLNPLVGAISAGCTAILKPSPYTPNVSTVMEQMIKETFEECHIATVQGDRDTNMQLLEKRFDFIFFTGSPSFGKTVQEAAARNLTPTILELGGKSPCILDESADLNIAARRIAWGKTLNAGQTCVAPDYLLIHSSLFEKFVTAFSNELTKMHGKEISKSKHYGRVVNDKAFKRISGYLKEGRIIYGGNTNPEERYIEPTLITDISPESSIMQEEIFGPILPVIPFKKLEEAVEYINRREKPLALYYFGNPETGFKIIDRTSSGGACINDTIMQTANENLPFGGVGYSGMGYYHGRNSFEAFSHRRAIVVTPTFFDIKLRYMPYKMFKLIKKIL